MVATSGKVIAKLSRLPKKLPREFKNLVCRLRVRAMAESGNSSVFGPRIDGNGLSLTSLTCIIQLQLSDFSTRWVLPLLILF